MMAVVCKIPDHCCFSCTRHHWVCLCKTFSDKAEDKYKQTALIDVTGEWRCVN